jgi:hypothetical protein
MMIATDIVSVEQEAAKMTETVQRETKRVHATLGPEALKELAYITDGGAKTVQQAITDSVWLDAKILRLLRSGGAVVFRYPDGRETELAPR